MFNQKPGLCYSLETQKQQKKMLKTAFSRHSVAAVGLSASFFGLATRGWELGNEREEWWEVEGEGLGMNRVVEWPQNM